MKKKLITKSSKKKTSKLKKFEENNLKIKKVRGK